MIGDLISSTLEIVGSVLGTDIRPTLHRPHDLRDREGMAQGNFEVALSASSGATSVDVRLTGSSRLKGRAPGGLRVDLNGQVRKLVSDCSVDENVLTIALSAPLTADLLPGDPVTVEAAASFDFTGLPCIHQSMSSDLGFEEYTSIPRLEVVIPKDGAPTTPRLGDVIENEEGQKCVVVGVPSDMGAAWALACGGF